jgi:integrase
MKGSINMDIPIGDRQNKKFGSVTTKSCSNNLYVDFYYHGNRIVKSTGMKDTSENRVIVNDWLINVHRKIENGSFVFADAFPGVSDKEKSKFAELEGWTYTAKPDEVLFGNYAETWRKKFLDTCKSETKKRDFNQVLDDWVLPKFGSMTFFQINGVVVKDFVVNNLKHRTGKKKGKALSVSRIRNILTPFRQIFEDACVEHNWSLFNPFEYANKKKIIGQKKKNPPVVLKFDQLSQIIKNFDSYYRDHTLMMQHTGMIGSELAGLRKSNIVGDEICIRNSIVRNDEKEELKTLYRIRQIPITEAIREILDRAIASANGEYLFTMKSGRHFNVDSYRKNAWTRALKKADVTYQRPYVIRHTFAAWALTIGLDLNRLVYLMGHSSKQMVFETYGKYVKGLEKDKDKILRFFGEEFVGLGTDKIGN